MTSRKRFITCPLGCSTRRGHTIGIPLFYTFSSTILIYSLDSFVSLTEHRAIGENTTDLPSNENPRLHIFHPRGEISGVCALNIVSFVFLPLTLLFFLSIFHVVLARLYL